MSTSTPLWMGISGQQPDLTWNEVNELAYEAGATPAELLEANLGLVYKLAAKHWKVVGSPDDLLDDYKQAAALGFMAYFRDDPKRWDPEQGTLGTAVSWTILSFMQKTVDAKQRHAIAIPQDIPAQMTEAALEGGVRYVPDLVYLDAPFDSDNDMSNTRHDVFEDPSTLDDIDKVTDVLDARQALVRVLSDMHHVPDKWRLAFRRWAEQGFVIDLTWRTHYRGEVSRQTVRNWVGLVLFELRDRNPDMVMGDQAIQPGSKVLEHWLARRDAELYARTSAS